MFSRNMDIPGQMAQWQEMAAELYDQTHHN